MCSSTINGYHHPLLGRSIELNNHGGPASASQWLSLLRRLPHRSEQSRRFTALGGGERPIYRLLTPGQVADKRMRQGQSRKELLVNHNFRNNAWWRSTPLEKIVTQKRVQRCLLL